MIKRTFLDARLLEVVESTIVVLIEFVGSIDTIEEYHGCDKGTPSQET